MLNRISNAGVFLIVSVLVFVVYNDWPSALITAFAASVYALDMWLTKSIDRHAERIDERMKEIERKLSEVYTKVSFNP